MDGRSRGIVRPARRPPGWVARGPRPAGPAGREDLWPAAGEDLCYLTGELRILQRLDGHRWSLDDLVTAAVAVRALEARPPARALDLGCGIGSVLMMVAWAFPEARCLGLEAQELSLGLARRSLAWNGLEGRVEVRLADLRDPAALEGEAPFDLVTGTPPYLAPGAGTPPGDPQELPCRFELRGGLEAYAAAAARALAPGGRFAVCEGAGRGARAEAALAAAGLGLLERVDVVPRAGKGALFSVFLCAPRPAVDEPARSALVVRDAAGRRTDAMRALRERMGLPP